MKPTMSACLTCIAAAATLSTPAFSQSATGFALNRFNPSERGSDWFSVESLDLRGDNRPAAGLVGDWAYKPLVLYDRDGEQSAALSEHQVYAHFGANWVFADCFGFAFNIPLALVNTGDVVDEGTSMGDLRFGGTVRLFGTYGDVITMAGELQVHLPTGSQDAFTGDGKLRVVPRILAAGAAGPIAYGGHVGFNIRAQNENFAGEPFGTELLFAAAAGVRALNRQLTVGPELYGSTVVSDGGDGLFARRTTPFELIAGAHYRMNNSWRVGTGVGPGLTRGIGTPRARVLASIEWSPAVQELPPPPPDTDRDGIRDPHDACPTVPGMASNDPKKNGCPPSADRDKDGIVDELDACPDQPGVASDDPSKNGCPASADRDADGFVDEQDACPDEPGLANEDPSKNGCPTADRDADGILDEQDACPDEPGVASDDPSKNGCPAPKDRDGDGILDEQDACPDAAGPPNPEHPNRHGCPKAQLVGTQIRLLERVEFDRDEATLRPESEPVLSAVLTLLQQHPEFTKVTVDGHTDISGSAAHNLALSRRRAASVVRWLMEHGIAAERLVSQGFGQTKPIDRNDTQQGRQNNRRVEFIVVESRAAPTDANP